ncbi:MAG TPA: NIPSNAP family protein [Puia sp.]|nr:NIPSNAP family protein [Puia sp.]
MNRIICRVLASALPSLFCFAAFAQKDIYEIKVFLLKSTDQVNATDRYLKEAYLPAMHRLGVGHIGVFKPLSNDTAAVQKIYVLTPYHSLQAWQKLGASLEQDAAYKQAAGSFINADTGHLPFVRIESILLEAFPTHTQITPAGLPLNSETLYELRSYESPTLRLHERKVTMFNQGDETGLFKRLGFNAVFYADVLSGARMPNLMYMIVFNNAQSREEHWKAFGNDPQWKKISADPQYQNAISVSHIDSILMHRTDYSDL